MKPNPVSPQKSMKFLTVFSPVWVMSPSRASSPREPLTFPPRQQSPAQPTQHHMGVGTGLSSRWRCLTLPQVPSPDSLQTVTVVGTRDTHFQSEPGTCSVTAAFCSFTQVLLSLRGWRHALHKQLHCGAPGTSEWISQWQIWCFLGRCWCQQQLLASSYASVQLWSFPFWQSCFTSKEIERRCMEDKSQAVQAISDLFISH